MKNIWFLRMDKDDLDGYDLNETFPFIHSVHGICGNKELSLKQKHLIFPKLKLSDSELSKRIISIKQQLIESNQLDENQQGKKRCDLAIRYWVGTMSIGDIVFVRNKQNQLYLCKISSYVKEEFFDENGCFQREIDQLRLLDELSIPEALKARTYGRKTIERNANKSIRLLVEAHYGSVV